MQMKFTLQVGQGKAKWRKVAADGFDAWITVPSGYAKYTYGRPCRDCCRARTTGPW